MAILKLLFAVFILSLPIGEIGRVQLGSISATINDILLFITVIIWLTLKIKNKKYAKSPTLLKPVGIFISIGFVSLIVNLRFLNEFSFFVSFLYLLRFTLYFCIYLIIFDFAKGFRNRILYILSISSLAIMFAGLVQFLFYPNLRNLYYLGWDEHLYRLFSTLLDPNFAGIILSLSFFLLLGLTVHFFKNKEKNKFLLFSLLSLVSFYEIYLTYSRSSFVMLIIGLLTFVLLLGRRKLSIIVVITLILTIFIIPNSFKTEGTNLLRTASTTARIASIKNGIEIFKDNPIIGVGFNSYRYAQHRYGFLTGGAWETTHAGAGLDNSLVFILATTGFIGLVSYLYVLYSMFKLAASKKTIYSIVLISSLLGLLASSLFINSLFYVFTMEWVWIIAAVTESS